MTTKKAKPADQGAAGKRQEGAAKLHKREKPVQPDENPLLGAWRTPFGLAPFAKIEPRHFEPAFKTALAEHREQVRRIGSQKAKPTFANTIRALEASGALLTRTADLFFNLTSANTNAEMQAIERRIAPLLARHESAIHLDKALFARIADLYGRRDALALGPEELRLVERMHTWFVRAGATLPAKAKKRVAEIKGRLAELMTTFAQNVLADEQSWHLILDSERDLAGLPPALRAAAKRAAEGLGRPDAHAITLARSSVEPFLQFSTRRDLREQAFKAWTRRGELSDKTHNGPVIAEVVALRSELARLMGYDSFAAYSLDDTMAKNVPNVRDLLERVWPHALGKAKEERDALARLAHSHGENESITAWDWRYWSEKERKARYDLDEAEVRPYLQLDNIIAAGFDTASRLFGLTFTEQTGVPVYHPDVRVWEVKNRAGEHVGLFLGDYFARPSKRSGAWMSSYRGQHRLGRGSRPIIVNVMSFAKGPDGAPTLLSLDDARTLFHELGHALHGLLSDVTYPSLSGTNVARDFVELPSQLYEHWLLRPEVLNRFALHVDTGRPMPQALLKRIEASRGFNQGFSTVEYTASAIVDLDLHETASTEELDVARFEQETLARIGMPDEIVMRHRLPHFLHSMGGYAAGYYSYLWSEVMDADAFAAFEETGDVFDAGVAGRLARHIYAAGNTQEPAAAYRSFRGRLPKVEGLLKKRGFVS